MSKTVSKLDASLPIVEDDVVFKLDEENRTIKLGNVVYGEIFNYPNSSFDQSQDGEITVMYHNDYVKDLHVQASEVKLFENRCDIGMGVCSLKEQDKYGICLEIKSKVACVILDEENQDRRYLLNVDSSRLKHFADISCDLCYFKNSIYDIAEIVYLIKLNFKNKIDIKIEIPKHTFNRKFTILGDKYNKNDMSKYFPDDKAFKLTYGEFVPFSFNEIIGKIVSVRFSELSKFKIDDQTIELIDCIDKNIDEDNLNKSDANANETSGSLKASFNLESNVEKREYDKLKRVTFTVVDVQAGEVKLNCVKDFKKSGSMDVKTEKVSGDQLSKIKFFNINKRTSEIGSRCKLVLNENDKLNATNFKGYDEWLNKIVKSKMSNLPKANQLGLENLDGYKVLANDCYEEQNKEPKDFIKLIDTKSDEYDEDDDIFLETEPSDKPDDQTKEDVKNNNLMMLNRLNRRSKSSSTRTHSLNNRSTNERLMNSSFKKLKFNSSVDDVLMNEDLDVSDFKAFQDLSSDKNQDQGKEVLVDVLYSDTYVDIHWQDNTIERDIPLGHVAEEIDNLIPKFYPGNFVNYVGDQKPEISPSYGVIQKVKQTANIAEVKWFYDDENSKKKDGSNELRPTVTLESLFNLTSSYMHYHLGDVVVDHCLILDPSKFKVENLPTLIGMIKQIPVDGTALVEWISGEKTYKKLVELVSFFDVDFSDYSDNEESFLSMNSDEMDSEISLSDSICNSLDNENKNNEKSKLMNGFKFNSYKFEYTKNSFDRSNFDKASFIPKWHKKINKMLSLIEESKDIQHEQLMKQGFYSQFNFEKDQKILELSHDIIKCYYEKIKHNFDQFNSEEENRENFDNFYSKLVYSLNNWLDLVQTQFDNFHILLEENIRFKKTNLSKLTSELKNLNPSDSEQLKNGIFRIKDEVEDKENQKQLLNDFRKKMIYLINRFNNEVVIDFSMTNDELSLCFNSSNSEIGVVNDDLNMSTNSNKSAELNDGSLNSLSIKFKKLNCVSLEDNNIKHEFLKSSSKKQLKVNLNTLQKELNLLKSSLPESGIYVRSFEERLDLFSMMIEGALDTVYENHLFLFDLKIQDDLSDPPEVVYLSFGKQQINPNLYLDGNVCLSLLGTFFGKVQEERWIAKKSSIYQLAMSLQALVLNKSPFFNEADFDVYNKTEEGHKKSKLYNEYVIISLITYCIDLMAKKDNTAFKNEIQKYYQSKASTIYARYCDFVLISMSWSESREKAELDDSLNDLEKEQKFRKWASVFHPDFELPGFTLMPGTEGFCLVLSKNLKLFLNEFKSFLPESADEMDKKVAESVASIQI